MGLWKVDTDRSRFGGKVEERRIEVADVLIEETRPLDIGCVEIVRPRMIVAIDVVPIFGNFTPACPSFCAKLPELLGIGGAAGEATTHTNDGDWDTGRGHVGCNYFEGQLSVLGEESTVVMFG